MKRREFLKTGLLFGAVAGTTVNSALGEIIIPTEENLLHSDMEKFIREMDIRMERISHSGGAHLNRLISASPEEKEQQYFRSSMRSLLLVGSFGALPIRGQVHPWMQKRMMYSDSEVDYSVNTSYSILRDMSEQSFEDIRKALADEPDLGSRILDTLDREAQDIGVASARRRQMKIMGRRVIRRMQHSPGMLVQEYVKKYEKLLQSSHSEETLDKLFKMQMEESEYSTLSREAEIASLHWKNSNIPDMPIAYGLMIDDKETDRSPERKPLKGGRLMGIGFVLTGVGWLLFGTNTTASMIGLVLGVTIGPLLIIIALIMLIVSANKRAKEN
jgi:hypothetical protein